MVILLLLIGILFAWIGLHLIWSQLKARLYSEKYRGKVIAYRKRFSTSSGSRNKAQYLFYPVIEYIARGSKREFQSGFGSSTPGLEIGEEVTVYYSTEDESARLHSFSPFVGGFFYTLAGGVLSYFSWILFEPEFFSILKAILITAAIVWVVLQIVKRYKIKGLRDLSERTKQTFKKTSELSEEDESDLITTPEQLYSTDLRNNRQLHIVAPLFFTVGLILSGLSVHFAMDQNRFMEIAISGEGEVVENVRRGSGDDTSYYPEVLFRIGEGESAREIRFRHSSGTNPPLYDVGEIVPVLYDPWDPYEAQIDQGVWNWTMPAIMGLMGILFAFAGFSLIKKWMKVRRYAKRAERMALG